MAKILWQSYGIIVLGCGGVFVTFVGWLCMCARACARAWVRVCVRVFSSLASWVFCCCCCIWFAFVCLSRRLETSNGILGSSTLYIKKKHSLFYFQCMHSCLSAEGNWIRPQIQPWTRCLVMIFRHCWTVCLLSSSFPISEGCNSRPRCVRYSVLTFVEFLVFCKVHYSMVAYEYISPVYVKSVTLHLFYHSLSCKCATVDVCAGNFIRGICIRS